MPIQEVTLFKRRIDPIQNTTRSILRRSQNFKLSETAVPKTESKTHKSKTRVDHPSFAIRDRFVSGEIPCKETMVLRTLARLIN